MFHNKTRNRLLLSTCIFIYILILEFFQDSIFPYIVNVGIGFWESNVVLWILFISIGIPLLIFIGTIYLAIGYGLVSIVIAKFTEMSAYKKCGHRQQKI